MDLLQNAYIKRYIDEMVNNLSILYPNLDTDEGREYLTRFVKKQVRAKVKDQPVVLQNTYTKYRGQTTLLSLAHWIETATPVITGNGSFYVQHAVETAPANQMLIHQKKQRSILKDKSFECRAKGDQMGYLMNHLGQGNEKIKMNSYYGAMGQKKSFQYNVSAAGAITSQGRSVISTTMWFNEAFLANHFIFETFDDMIHYIKLILKEEINVEKYEYIEYIPTDLEIVDYYMRHYEGTENKRVIAGMLYYTLSKLSNSQKIKIYYKNNLVEWMDRNPKVRQIVLDVVNSPTDYLNPYEIPEEFKAPFDLLWNLVSEFIFMNDYIPYNKVHKFLNHKRKVIMYSDTDSVFIYMGFWVFKVYEYLTGKKIEDITMDELESQKPLIFKIINILTNDIYIGIHKIYKTLCQNAHVFDDSYKKWVSIKNEFVFDKFVMFDIKKNYIYREVMNEGKILNPPNVDVKGGNLNPKAKNKIVTKRIKEIVNEVTMSQGKIYPELLLKRIFELRDTIVTSLKSGSIDYVIPTKVKSPQEYDNPYSQFKFRGVEAYRIATEDPSITLPSSFNVIDVKMERLEDLEWLKENYPAIYEKLRVGVYEDSRLGKYGIKYICIPMKLDRIPDWIIPYIDTDQIWRKHANPLISLSPSLGIKQDEIKTNTYYSTILNI